MKRIYSEVDYLVLSLKYAELRYVKSRKFYYPIYDHKLLFTVFKSSIEKGINLFKYKSDLEHLFKEIIEQTIYDNLPSSKFEEKLQRVKEIFLNHEATRKKAELNLMECEKRNITFVVYEDENYPKALKNIPDPPYMIFFIGKIPNFESTKSIAIVGSRRAGKKGLKKAYELALELANKGMLIVSGLAIGTDTSAHEGALESGKDITTAAILAQGLASFPEKIYPPENKELARRIVERGFLMSELPPLVNLKGLYLIWRDRLQSGLSEGIVVIETGKKGGTMHTVSYAMVQKRKIFVLDPEILEEDPEDVIEGNRKLLKSGALKVRQSEDILKVLALAKNRSLEPNKHEDIKYKNLRLF